MTTEAGIWNQVTESLKSKLSASEINTWFSQTTLKELSTDLAIIGVPNKFFAHWLRDKYLVDIQSSFKKILGQNPKIEFTYDQLPTNHNIPKSQSNLLRESVFKTGLNPFPPPPHDFLFSVIWFFHPTIHTETLM